ncbi:carbon-nitrogen hydrolase family protein [Sphingomonas sp. 37zxx]|uniref:carbon-nitrogen hydrolase family protein n=1 Tax=Sphingomonas sp. 37zxx TaxID=1550073 RepID=UPI00053C0154|nr:carbon-nitrogen hydrolase family protein [Sphingomonas sp. 37zxx]
MTKIAVLQMTGGIDPASNAETLATGIAEAGSEGALILFTPELSGFVDQDNERAAKAVVAELDDPVLMRVREAAATAGIWVHLGSLIVCREDGRWANRGYMIDGKGRVRARYDKLHLFDVDLPTGERWRESAIYAPGQTANLVDTPVGTMGLSICYDMRFPDLFRTLSDAGAEVLSVPAAFTRPTGAAHWHVLLRARAIEAGAWVIAAGQTGRHEDGRETYGHSLVIDPWGDIVLDMGEDAGLKFADIDPARLAEVRTRVPALRHRRPIPDVLRG